VSRSGGTPPDRWNASDRFTAAKSNAAASAIGRQQTAPQVGDSSGADSVRSGVDPNSPRRRRLARSARLRPEAAIAFLPFR